MTARLKRKPLRSLTERMFHNTHYALMNATFQKVTASNDNRTLGARLVAEVAALGRSIAAGGVDGKHASVPSAAVANLPPRMPIHHLPRARR